jgi:hypothetical protein
MKTIVLSVLVSAISLWAHITVTTALRLGETEEVLNSIVDENENVPGDGKERIIL